MSDTIDHEKLEESVRTLLGHAYTPPRPREEFKVNLLDELKGKQKELASARAERPRKTTLLKLFPAGIAAAAALLIVVALPKGTVTPPPAIRDIPVMTPPDAPDSIRVGALAIEYNKNGEWRQIDNPRHLTLTTGTKIRTGSTKREAGIGLDNGVRMMLMPETGLSYTDKGFQLDYGKAIVKVPEKAKSFALHLSEQNVFTEPGTFLQVEAANPERYAPGGTPAPAVKVYYGGLAFVGNDTTVAPLFAGNRYQLHNFQTQDIPGHPMGKTEQYLPDFGSILIEGGGTYSPRITRKISPPKVPTDKQREFRYENETWIDPVYTAGTPTRKIKYLSGEYINLLKANRNLCDALALGSSVIVKHQNGFIEITP